MTSLTYLSVAVAAVAALALSGAWYAAFGSRLARLSAAYADRGTARSQAATAAVELGRNLLLALVVAALATRVEATTVVAAVTLAMVLWIGFPVVLLSGSVFHERVPWRLAAIHLGDWLLKLVATSTIVSLWS